MLSDRADERIHEDALVSDGREVRQVFANANTGHFCRDGLEFATHFGRRVHLQVIHVLMRWPAWHVDHDDCFARTPLASLLLGTEELRQGKAAQAKRAYLNEIAPRLLITEGAPGFSKDI